MFLSIIVPAYKQEKTIKEDIERICDVMSHTRYEYELLIVVDGFVDSTFEQAKKIKDPHVSVYGYENNRGKGYAVRYGMARADGDYIAFIDSGMEIDPNGISMLLEHMIWYKADIIVGSKRHPASRVKYPTMRRIFSWCYSMFVRVLFRIKVSDTQVGLKVFRRQVLEKVLPRLVVKRFGFDIELLAVSKYLGFRRIYEAPVELSMDFRAGSVLNPKFFDFARAFLLDTIAVFYRMYILRYYHPSSKPKWKYDKELDMRVNTGELSR